MAGCRSDTPNGFSCLRTRRSCNRCIRSIPTPHCRRTAVPLRSDFDSFTFHPATRNLIGSVAFGVSAVAGYINPATGQIHNAERSNLGTLVGAVCFFVGALLLLPERTEDGHHPVATPDVIST